MRQFLAVAHTVFADDPAWIAPLTFERLMHLDPAKNPFFQDAEVAFWVAERQGRAVGRISAQMYRKPDPDTGLRCAHFGFLDAIDDAHVFRALLAHSESWLKARGAERVTGPFTMSINEESGLLIDGFLTPPYIMMGHARPYYAAHLDALGYAGVKDLLAYHYDLAIEPPSAVRGFILKARSEEGITFRALRMSEFTAEIGRVAAVFNDAWADNWGFVPFSPADIAHLAKNIRPLLRADDVAIAEIWDEPVAMAVCLPNLNEAIGDLGGRVLPFGWMKLLWRLKIAGLKTARVPLMGVVRRYRGTPLGIGLGLGVIDMVRRAHLARGTREAELSWILDDNVPARRLIEMMGGVAYKTYRVFAKTLT